MDGDVGTVTPGKYADIIAVRGDVLRHIALLQRVDVVVKRGNALQVSRRFQERLSALGSGLQEERTRPTAHHDDLEAHKAHEERFMLDSSRAS